MITHAKQVVRQCAVELFGDGIGCSDGGCVFGHPGGMHTNGGCRCLKERDAALLRRTIQELALITRRLAAPRSA